MNNFDLKGRTAIITGGAQGFGLDITKRFLDSGSKVIIWDIDQKELEKLLTGINKIKKDKNILKPIAIKISPDINTNEISKIIELIIKFKIAGIIVSNTTDSNREKLSDVKKNEMGGL